MGLTKKHNLVLKVAIIDLKNHLLFIAFLDSYLMIDIDGIKLGKTLNPIWLI